jgi:hypothetical protein
LKSRPSWNCALFNPSRPISLPDRKSSRKKGGYVSTLSRRKSGLTASDSTPLKKGNTPQKWERLRGLSGWRGNRKLENSVFIRIIGALALLFLGSYLFAEGLSNLILLPITVVVDGLSGPQALSQLQALQNQFILQLASGIICLTGSLFVAFFKFDPVKPRPQL